MSEEPLSPPPGSSDRSSAEKGWTSHDLADPPGAEPDGIDPEAFKRGDAESFRGVLDRYGPLIRSVVGSFTKIDADREDLYQEVSIRILEQRDKYSEQGSMGAWIRSVARRVALNWRASQHAQTNAKSKYETTVVPIEASAHITSDPSRLLNYRELLANVERALDAIPERQAEAFRLVHIRGYSPREVAKMQGVEASTVRSNLRHARKRLREHLAEVRDALS